MKRTLLILLTVVAMAGLLAGCKANETPVPVMELPQPTATAVYDQWEYQSVMMQCQPDMGTGNMACYVVKDDDNTYLESYLKAMGGQGWDLVQIIQHDQGGKNGGFMTVVFKRLKPAAAPAPVEPTPTP